MTEESAFPREQAAAELEQVLARLGKHLLFYRSKARAEGGELLARLESRIRALDTDNREKQVTNEGLEKSVDSLQEEAQSKDKLLRRFGLVSAALSPPLPKSPSLEAFASLVDSDFKEFCDKECRINNVVSYQKLRHLLDEMQLLANLPALHSRTIGVIGGGFSSGKSAFLNSLLDRSSNVKLAEGILPVTAIPSYVMHDASVEIRGVNHMGSMFDIEPETYREISHEFLKDFPYLRDIVPYITVSAPMSATGFDNLCFIDTPGYNPAVAGTTSHDLETARAYIKDASFLIWMVGVDSNGTIPQSDLDFLTGLGFGQSKDKPLYVVVSKADLKPLGDIEDIIETFAECLGDSDLHHAGISAYSARQRKVVSTHGQGLFEFIAQHNVLREHYSNLIGNLCEAFRPFVEEIHRSDSESRTLQKSISNLLMEALRTGAIDATVEDSPLEQGLLDLENQFRKLESLDSRIKQTQETFQKFVQCIDDFCDEIGMAKFSLTAAAASLFTALPLTIDAKKKPAGLKKKIETNLDETDGGNEQQNCSSEGNWQGNRKENSAPENSEEGDPGSRHPWWSSHEEGNEETSGEGTSEESLPVETTVVNDAFPPPTALLNIFRGYKFSKNELRRFDIENLPAQRAVLLDEEDSRKESRDEALHYTALASVLRRISDKSTPVG